MADESAQETQDIPAVIEQAHEHTSPPSESPWEAHAASSGTDNPLPLMAAAFVGGVLAARILKKLGGDD